MVVGAAGEVIRSSWCDFLGQGLQAASVLAGRIVVKRSAMWWERDPRCPLDEKGKLITPHDA